MNSSGFGIAVSCGISGAGFSDFDVPEINAVTVEVFYSLPANKSEMMLLGVG